MNFRYTMAIIKHNIFSNFIFTPLNHNLHVQKTHSNSDFINSMIYFVNAIIFKMLSENQRKYEKKTTTKKKENKEKKKQQLMQSIKIKENIEGT